MSRSSVSQAALPLPPACARTVSLPRPRWHKTAAWTLRGCGCVVPIVRGRPIVVGTASAADLRVQDAFVSARHAELRADAHAVRIEDLGSKNGTFVDGVLVDRAWIRAGARIRIGGAELQLHGVGPSAETATPHDASPRLLGDSVRMQTVRERLERLAGVPQPVLVHGETGTGKELAARLLHEHGLRPDGPFVALNCGSIPEQLAESELFGHQRGAFTGAHRDRVGAFGRASGGTLFLDEVGELPPLLQAKLLRTLETGEMLPVGAEREVPTDVRIVAATHRDLRGMVCSGKMREDLYHRLAVLTVELPPLRHRREDIPALVAAFAMQAEAQLKRPACFGPEAIRAAQSHPWPGNVRELRNAVLRAVTLGEPELRPDAYEPPIAIPGANAPASITTTTTTTARDAIEVPRGDFESMKRALLQRVVAEQGSIRQAASVLGIPRSTLGSWLSPR